MESIRHRPEVGESRDPCCDDRDSQSMTAHDDDAKFVVMTRRFAQSSMMMNPIRGV